MTLREALTLAALLLGMVTYVALFMAVYVCWGHDQSDTDTLT